jgi:hypothetical protein
MTEMVRQTRFKVVLLGLAIGLVEGALRVCFPTFPLVETFSFQGAVVGAYLAARTVSDVKFNNGEEK